MFGGPDPFSPAKPQAVAGFTQQEGRNPLHDAINLPKIATNPPSQGGIPDDFGIHWAALLRRDELGMPAFKPVDPFCQWRSFGVTG